MRKPKHVPTDAEQAEMRRLFEEGNLTDHAIADKVGVTHTTVRGYRIQLGYRRTRHEDDPRVMAAVRDTSLSVAQAAKKVGINDTSIGWLRKKYGIKSDVYAEAERRKAERRERQIAEQIQAKIDQTADQRSRSRHRPALTFETVADELAYLMRQRRKVEEAMDAAADAGNIPEYMRLSQQYSTLTYRIEFCESRMRTNRANDGDSEGGQIAFWNGHANTAPEPIY